MRRVCASYKFVSHTKVIIPLRGYMRLVTRYHLVPSLLVSPLIHHNYMCVIGSADSRIVGDGFTRSSGPK